MEQVGSYIPLKPFKILVGVALLLVIFASIQTFFNERSGFAQTLLSLYLIAGGAVCLLQEFSPDAIEQYINAMVPIFGTYLGRGIIFIIMGSFCLDPTLQRRWFAGTGGILIILCGLMYIIFRKTFEDKGETPEQRLNVFQDNKETAMGEYAPPYQAA